MRAPLLFLPGLAVAALYALARPILFDGYGLPVFFAYGFVAGGALAVLANRRYGEPKPNAWLALLFKPQTIKQRALSFYFVLFFWACMAYIDINHFGGFDSLFDNLAPFEYALSYVWLNAGGAILGFFVAWNSIRDWGKAFFIVSFGALLLHCLYAIFLILVLPRVEAWALRGIATWWVCGVFVMYVGLTAKFFINRFRRRRAAASK